MTPSSKRNLKTFQILILVMAMILTLVGCLLIKSSFLLGLFQLIGALGWIVIYLFSSPKIRKFLFSNLFEEPAQAELSDSADLAGK
jgi:hypothetical protein